MKTDRRSVVLPSSLTPSAGPLRGHRSLGDENLTLTGPAGRRQGAIQDRTNINARGWNNSTRASPIWKRKEKDNKENSRHLPKKFQHVQSKLSAPVFSQRRAKQAEGTARAAGSASADSPLQASANTQYLPGSLANAESVCGQTCAPEDSVPLVVFDEFVTDRRRGQQPQDGASVEHQLAASGFVSEPVAPANSQPELREEVVPHASRLAVSPVPRPSPHPSVSALYQYAQEMRTPLSYGSRPAASGTPTDCVNMFRALESAAQGLDPEATPEELTDSFGSWLTSMGMKEEALPDVTLNNMRAMWQTAKEAVQLQALVEQLKEQELRLAQQQADESARHYGLLLAENKGLTDETICLKRQLLFAEERLARLAQSSTSIYVAEAPLGVDVPALIEPNHTEPAGTAESNSPVSSPGVADVVPQADKPVGSPASVNQESARRSGSPVETRFLAANEAGVHREDLPQGAGSLKRGDGTLSISLGSPFHPGFSSTSAATDGPRIETSLPSPSSCATVIGATVSLTAAAPDLSVVSRMPEAVPFAIWLAGVGSPAASPSPRLDPSAPEESPAAAATPEVTMPSPGAVLSSAASGLSAGLSFVSRPVEPVAFAAWATLAKEDAQTSADRNGCMVLQGSPDVLPGLVGKGVEISASTIKAVETPSERSFNLGGANEFQAATPQWPGLGDAAGGLLSPPSDHDGTPDSLGFGGPPIRHANAGQDSSPQQSAGLSEASSMPQAMAFDVWASVQRARAAQAATSNVQGSPAPFGAVSPLSSVGLETVSKPLPPRSWRNGQRNTLLEDTANAAQATPSAHVRCNPLFEYDSPASSISALPERADAFGGLAATPSPAHMVTAPSLASTPMSDFSQGMRSNFASPIGIGIAGSPTVHLYGSNSRGLFGPNSSPLGAMSSPMGAVPVAVAATVTTPPSGPAPVGSPIYPMEASGLAPGGNGDGPPHNEFSVQCEPSFHEQVPNRSDGDEPCSPAFVEALTCSPLCAMPEAVPGAAPEDVRATAAASPKDMPSPAADSVITTKFAASPCNHHAREGEATQLTEQATDGVLVGTVAGCGDQGGIVCIDKSLAAALCEQTSAHPISASQKPSPGSDGAITPDERAAPVAAGASSHSYPNTPSAAWPMLPTTSMYATPLEAFPTPASLASFCSTICLTAMRMQSDISVPAQGHLSGSNTPTDFSFGLPQSRGPGQLGEAPTPAFGPAVQVSANPAFTPGALRSEPGQGAACFGSPLPLQQLTPLQMRALDQIAGHVIAALSPAGKLFSCDRVSSPAQPESDQNRPAPNGDSQIVNAHGPASASFNLSQLLAQLRSPLPVPVHQRSSHFVPGQDHAGAVPPSTRASVTKPQCDVPHCRLTSSLSDQIAEAALPEPSNSQVVDESQAAPVFAPSPMPNFARLMAFLNAGGRAVLAASTSRSNAGSSAACPAHDGACDADVVATVATAAVSFAQLLAQLHSPLPNHSGLCPVLITAGAGNIDSPVTANAAHDSPANSEAASFGFSTAAKLSARQAPSTTPGGDGLSFVRWTGALPSFHLDSDAAKPRSRTAHNPPTPMSFSFGAPFGGMPNHEESTPAFGHGAVQNSHVLNEPPPEKQQGSQSSPVAEGIRQGLVSGLLGAMESPEHVCPAPSASFTFDAAAAASVPGLVCGGADASPAFSFGGQLRGLASQMATPGAPFGPGSTQDGTAPVEREAEVARSAVRCHVWDRAGNTARQGISPAVSLGIWGLPANDSRTPSERGFGGFTNVAGSMMATPVWPGLGAAARVGLSVEEPAADFVRNMSAALDQLVAAASPTLFGMAAEDSPQDTPGVTQRAPSAPTEVNMHLDAYAPAATAVMWAALIGNVQSPMPAAVHARAQQRSRVLTTSVAVAAHAPSLDTAPSAGAPSGASSTGVAIGAEAAPAVKYEVPPAPQTARDGPTCLSAEAPPPYEDLPDLIARGLCLSASTPAPPMDVPVTGLLLDTSCSSIGENPTPCVRRTEAVDETTPAVVPLSIGSVASSSEPRCPPTDRLFQPVPLPVDDSPSARARLTPEQLLVVESVSGSSGRGSAGTLYAADLACRTTEPLETLAAGPINTGDAVPNVESVHSSPVFSFHVASENSARSADPVTTTAAEAAVVEADRAEAVAPRALSIAIMPDQSNYAGASQHSSPAAATKRPQPEESPVQFSVDAVPKLLFGASVGSTAELPMEGSKHNSAAPSDRSASDAVATVVGSMGDLPASLSMVSPAAFKQRDVGEGPGSPLTFSYLGSAVPSSTPPTAEIASTGKGAAPLGHPRVSPRANGGQFWAPSPSGPSAASGDRVTLEASNRRIRANADLLLDFQGSPGHVGPAPPIVTGVVTTPRMKGAGLSAARSSATPPPFSPTGKILELVLSPRHLNIAMQAPPVAAARFHAPVDVAAKPVALEVQGSSAVAPFSQELAFHTACQQAGSAAGGNSLVTAQQTSTRTFARQPAYGPPMQQLMATGIGQVLASATAAVPQHSAMTTVHVPLSQRLGLTQQAAWGIPCAGPTGSLPPPRLTLAHQHTAAQQPASASLAPPKPLLTSRDVQTTPGLIKTPQDHKSMGADVTEPQAADTKPVDSAPAQLPVILRAGEAPEGGSIGVRKPVWRSRIPAPAGLPAAPAPAAFSSFSGTSTAVSSDEGEQNSEMPTERVVRRRRPVTGAAAVGGPQRVLAKRGMQKRSNAQEEGEATPMSEAEMRRRAQILGMRISPYLRKHGKAGQSKARLVEAPKATKG